MYIYFAHPIDQVVGHSPLTEAIQDLHAQAHFQGHSLFRPAAAHRVGSTWTPEDLAKVDEINRYALWQADAVVAILPPGLPTLGTPAEIEFALQLNRPTLVVTTAEFAAASVQISSWVRRGAVLRFMNQEGKVSPLSFADALSTLPNPTKVFNELLPPVPHHPTLLVSGLAANCQKGKYPGDAGLDLAINRELRLEADEFAYASTSVHVAIPDGYFGWITGRSSTWSKYRCDVRTGIIDSGYRGELLVGLHNRGQDAVVFEAGMRLAQLILLPAWGGPMIWTQQLPAHEREHNGFGSSGQ